MGYSISSFKRDVYTDKSYLKKQQIFQISNLTLHLKELLTEEQKNPKASRRKEIIKIR